MNYSDEFKKAVSSANGNFMSTFKKGDAAGMAALYTESAEFLPPNSDSVKGREGIKALYQNFIGMGVKAINLETVDTEVSGDIGFETGKYVLEVDGGQVIDKGKYMVVWKKEAGEWKLHRDIINTSMPPAK